LLTGAYFLIVAPVSVATKNYHCLVIGGVAVLNLAACHGPSHTPDRAAQMVRARLGPNQVDIIWLKEKRVAGTAVACGLARQMPPSGNRGPPTDNLFIVLNGRAYIPGDVTAAQFDSWGDRFCGPSWVNPRWQPGIS